jgi:hypothetical protein
MIEGLRSALAAHDLPALPELEIAVGDSLCVPRRPARVVELERLKSHVFRVRVAIMNEVRALVIKCMEPQPARRNELVIRRWLPRAGLMGITPALLGIGARRSGGWVWHVYEDLGPGTLDPGVPDHPGVARAVELIASIHARFAAHPLLAECRLDGRDLGISFYSASVRDAIRNLEALVPPLIEVTTAEAAIRDRLLGRLRKLRDEEPERARALARWGGPETLLHGDLWTTNAFVEPAADGPRVRFIDWDRAGLGSASYDLSTFLMRFAPGHRASILDLYRGAADSGFWRMPDNRELNLLFETAEFARYANMAIWPAVWLGRERVAWGFDQLAEVDRWFEAFQPVVPAPQPCDT